MNIIVLHWHGVCPHCNKKSCIYIDFYRDENGTKLPYGFECDFCGAHITDEEFKKIKLVDYPCPKDVIKKGG